MRARDIALINAALCADKSSEFNVVRPHNLDLIISNIEKDFRSSDHYRKAAHIGYMINSLQPFANENQQTALLATLLYLQQNSQKIPNQHKLSHVADSFGSISSADALAEMIR